MGMSWAEHSVEIEAPIEVAFDAIVDYESFSGWQNAVDRVEVIDRTPEGVGRTVRLFVDAKIRKIDYVLRYSYARPTRIEWDFVEGNGMRFMDGTYSFEQLGPGRTRATYNLGADPEIPVPGMVLRRTHKQLVKRSVEDLKREAERRAQAGAGAGSPAAPPEAAPGPTEPAREAAPPPGPAAPPPQPAKPAAEPSAPAPEAEVVPPAPEAEVVPSAPAAPEAAPPPEPEPAAPPEHAPSPASGAAPPAAGEWMPLGARGGPGRSGPSGGREGPPSALPAEELAERAAAAAGQALRIGRGLAAGALRTGLAAGREAAERIDRRLSGREPYEPR